LVVLTANGLNFDELNLEVLYENHTVATWNIGNRVVIWLKTEENQENLCLDGWSQDLPDAH
jgi:hypothetical protein